LLNIAMMVSLRITLTYARTGSSLPVMSKMHHLMGGGTF
jgi:hypothetical protein